MADHPYNVSDEIIKVPRFAESAGFYTTRQRSKTMAKIKGKNSAVEMLLRRTLWAQRVRYRIHVKLLPGKPDLMIKKYKLAVFVDGDFWHGYQWEKKKAALKSNQAFWIPKIERNMQRDRVNNQSLQDAGYTVMRFWEHEIKQNLDVCVNQIMLYIEAAKVRDIPTLYYRA